MPISSPTGIDSRTTTKGRRFPADPPRVEETVAVMRGAGKRPHGLRLRALIVILWRSGLRISEALALAETDLKVESEFGQITMTGDWAPDRCVPSARSAVQRMKRGLLIACAAALALG